MICLEELHSCIAADQPNLCGLTVLQGGKELLSDTWNGWRKKDTVHTMSVTKSVVSLLVGIAIEQGLIASVEDRVLDYFPDYEVKRGEKTIQNVTLHHLLTMTAPYKYRSEPWSKVCVQDDWTIAALDLLGGRSGTLGEYRYSTLGIHILTGILANQSGLTTVEYANRYLLAPLGIADRSVYVAPDAAAHKAFTIEKVPKGRIWFSDPKGVGTAGYGLCLSADEMAKLGQLCLQGGVWNGKRIVSEKWLLISTEPKAVSGKAFGGMEYGYLWWVLDREKRIYAALGNSGNAIYINPEKELVISAAAFFKPAFIDRIAFIRELEQLL